MKAAVWKEPYKVVVEEVDDPRIEHPTDAVLRLTTTAICGSDLHMFDRLPLDAVGEAHEKFDKRVDGYTKVLLKPELVA